MVDVNLVHAVRVNTPANNPRYEISPTDSRGRALVLEQRHRNASDCVCPRKLDYFPTRETRVRCVGIVSAFRKLLSRRNLPALRPHSTAARRIPCRKLDILPDTATRFIIVTARGGKGRMSDELLWCHMQAIKTAELASFVVERPPAG